MTRLITFFQVSEFVGKFSTKRRSALKKFEVLFNGDLVYKFTKIMGRTDFLDQFRKIIIRHKRIGYDLNAT